VSLLQTSQGYLSCQQQIRQTFVELVELDSRWLSEVRKRKRSIGKRRGRHHHHESICLELQLNLNFVLHLSELLQLQMSQPLYLLIYTLLQQRTLIFEPSIMMPQFSFVLCYLQASLSDEFLLLTLDYQFQLMMVWSILGLIFSVVLGQIFFIQ